MRQGTHENGLNALSKVDFPLAQRQVSSLAELQARNSKRQVDSTKGETQQRAIYHNHNHLSRDIESNSNDMYQQNIEDTDECNNQKDPKTIDMPYDQECKELFTKTLNEARDDIFVLADNHYLSSSSFSDVKQILAEKEQLRRDNISLFEIIQQQNERIQQLVMISNKLQHQQHPQVLLSSSQSSSSPQSTAADNQGIQSNGRYESQNKLSGNSSIASRYATKAVCQQGNADQNEKDIPSSSCTFNQGCLPQGLQAQQTRQHSYSNHVGSYESYQNSNSKTKGAFRQFEKQIQNIKEGDIIQFQEFNNNSLRTNCANNQNNKIDHSHNNQEQTSDLMILHLQEQVQSLQQSLKETHIEKNLLRDTLISKEQQAEMYVTLQRDYQELIGLVLQLGDEWGDYEEQQQCILIKQEEQQQQKQENTQFQAQNLMQNTTQVCVNCLGMLKQHHLITEELKQRIKHNEYVATQVQVKLHEEINMLQIQNKKLLDSL